MAGTMFNGPDGRVYEIKSVTNNGNITLFDSYKGETAVNQPYSIFTTYPGDLSQFAAQFNALLSYYQLTRSNMMNVLTGKGEVSVTGDDGTVVSVPGMGDLEQFRRNLGLKDAAQHDVQASSADATAGRILKIANNGAGPFGLGSSATLLAATDIVVQLRSAVDGWYRCPANTVRAPSVRAWTFHVMKWDDNTRCVLAMSTESGEGVSYIVIKPNTDSGWIPFWDSNNLPNPATLNTDQIFNGNNTFINNPILSRANYSGLRLNISTLPENTVGAHSQLVLENLNSLPYLTIFARVSESNTTGQIITRIPLQSGGTIESPNKYGIGTTSPSVVSQYPTSFPGGMMFYQETTDSGNTPESGLQAWKVLTMPLNSASWSQLWANHANSTAAQRLYYRNRRSGTSYAYCNILMSNQYTVDASGNYKTASPVINIYADGSFTATEEAKGVNVERLSEGVYRITGCQGMHSDAAWNGIDGGVSNPKCRNDKALLWNNYEVDEDGSVTVYTFHRVHTDAMPFAQNRLTLDKKPFDPEKGHTPEMEWPDKSPIDVPKGLFIQVRVNMPERIEPQPTISHSNVYCNTIAPA
nr:hypothetical protein B7L51_03915 [Pectobacterium carotovorum]OYN52680.1 hypothetical protein B7L51_04020 [Pectobacterium carotovorum]